MKLFSLLIGAISASGWEYPENGGTWADTCKDQKRGSPIDFRYVYERNKYDNLGQFSFNPGYSKLANWDVTNNGHSIVLSNPTDNEGNPVESIVSGGGLAHDYKFHSFHFHWGTSNGQGGSEHTVNGKHYFSEVHLVHHRADCPSLGDCLQYSDGLAVLGFFLDITDDPLFRDNLFLHRLVSSTQRHHMKIGDSKSNSQSFKLNSFLPESQELQTFYRYDGSLTTPGCNEVVIWTVFKKPIFISSQMVRSFARLIREEHHEGKKEHGLYTKRHYLENNYREVQDLNYREVIVSSPNPGLAFMLMSNEAQLARLEREIASKDNFSEVIAHAINQH